MTYEEALSRLTGAKRLGARPGLETMARMMEKLGSPEKALKFVHIAGTNGKGSTAAYLAAMLRAAGYKTGLFTSPFIEDFRERIQVDGACISREETAALTEQVLAAAQAAEEEGLQAATSFELVTALGLLHFAAAGCDIVVLEVGLGGRLDATNIIPAPEAAVLTSIGMDHMELLGDSLEKIAWEKAGILKPGCPAVACGQGEEVLSVFRACAWEKGCALTIAEPGRLREMSPAGLCFDWKKMQALHTGMTGLHQMENAVTALAAAEALESRGWKIGEAAVRKGLAAAKMPGRMEKLCDAPLFLVDGAHNAPGIRALMGSLEALHPGKKWRFLVGVLADKDYQAGLAAALPLAEAFYTVTPPSPRALPAEALAAALKDCCDLPVRAFAGPAAAAAALLADCGPGALCCAFGSMYQIGELRHFFAQKGAK